MLTKQSLRYTFKMVTQISVKAMIKQIGYKNLTRVPVEININAKETNKKTLSTRNI